MKTSKTAKEISRKIDEAIDAHVAAILDPETQDQPAADPQNLRAIVKRLADAADTMGVRDEVIAYRKARAEKLAKPRAAKPRAPKAPKTPKATKAAAA